MIAAKGLNGILVVTEIIDGYLVKESYIGCTIKEAKKKFKDKYYKKKVI